MHQATDKGHFGPLKTQHHTPRQLFNSSTLTYTFPFFDKSPLVVSESLDPDIRYLKTRINH